MLPRTRRFVSCLCSVLGIEQTGRRPEAGDPRESNTLDFGFFFLACTWIGTRIPRQSRGLNVYLICPPASSLQSPAYLSFSLACASGWCFKSPGKAGG